MTPQFAERARAKINLTLHVGRAITDADRYHGYHPVDSLVVFADIGDDLSARPAPDTSLQVVGERGGSLSDHADNLVMRAMAAVENAPDLALVLTKTLPISSGLGGGSADAAALLRLVCPLVAERDWMELAERLGADVPVCLGSRTAHMTGIGECVRELPGLGTVDAVLVNPGIGVSTAEVFRAFDGRDGLGDTPRPQADAGSLLDRARHGRNDLQPVAVELVPEIATVLQMIGETGADLVRMTGSGATCFGLYSDAKLARTAARTLENVEGWWVRQAVLGDPD